MHKSISTHIHNHWSIWCRLTFWLVFGFAFFQLHNSLQFFFVCLFYKIKTEEHSNLHNATLLWRFRFYVGENSRTFQDCANPVFSVGKFWHLFFWGSLILVGFFWGGGHSKQSEDSILEIFMEMWKCRQIPTICPDLSAFPYISLQNFLRF